MERYVSHKNENGAPIISLIDTYNKVKLAARLIAGVQNPADVMVVSSRPSGQRAALKFAQLTGATAATESKWVPGCLTNQETTKHFKEPRLLVVVDPFADKKAIIEASYANIPVIALANLDSELKLVDVCIPCNNKKTEPVSMVFWLLTREVLVLTGKLGREEQWDVLVDLFYYREVEHILPGATEEKAPAQVEETADQAADAEEERKWDVDA